MKKPWIIFLICIAAGVILAASWTLREQPLMDSPTRIPTRTEVVVPGLSTYDIVKTGDESRVPELMQPTAIVKLVTKRLLDISCNKGTERCKLQAIYDFVRTNYEYKSTTPEHSYIQSPGETLFQGAGDQLELALLLASMQRAADFENEILKSPYHSFVRVQLNNQSIMIDPSCQSCRFMEARVSLRGDEKVFS